MKTPIQELIEQLTFSMNNTDKNSKECTAYAIAIVHAEAMLEKEKDVMCQFQSDGQRKDFWVKYEDNEDCFNKTFKTK